MSISAPAGPTVNYGQQPPVSAGAAPSDYNPDRAPSINDLGAGLLDPNFGFAIGGGGMGAASPAGSALAFMYAPGVNYVTLDQAPSTAATANIAALANVVSGTPMTLVSASGAGVTVMTSPLFIKPSGNTVPAVLALDGLPGFQAFGENHGLLAWDPTTILSRVVSITGSLSGTGGAFLVKGYDYRGHPQSETITAGAGAVTTNGKKAWKFIASVTPQFTDAHNYSVGTADIFGLPLRADVYGYVIATWNNVPVATPTFVKADTTSPATATTGDVRGTIVPPSSSDGTKRVQVMQGISPANLAALTATSYVGMFGVTPA